VLTNSDEIWYTVTGNYKNIILSGNCHFPSARLTENYLRGMNNLNEDSILLGSLRTSELITTRPFHVTRDT